jgi:phosphate-selective porin OprO/OprP
MNKLIQYGALAAFIGGGIGIAHADQAETKGGIKIKTEDGRFEANINGRIHFDTYVFDEDDDASFGSVNQTTRGGTDFRRTYLTLTGKLYDWKYKFEYDLTAQGAGASGKAAYREMWIGTTIGPGDLYIGQFKPFRGMEELTSSNEILLMERPVTTASGVYAGRQYLPGIGYKGLFMDQIGWGVSYQSLSQGDATVNEGAAYGGRLFWVPMSAEGQTFHVGTSYYIDREANGSSAAAPAFTYGGRRGPAVTFGGAGAAETDGFGKQNTLAFELAGSFGPITLQGEYSMAELEDAYVDGGAEDADLDAWYVQASWFVTGENKPYKKDRGAFGTPKPINPYGAWELALRYESIESKDEDDANSLCTVTTGLALPAGAAVASKCEVQQLTVGVNWYVNPNVRFMLDYYKGEADLGGAADKDKPDAVSLRTQLSF